MKVYTNYKDGRLTVYLIGELDHHSAQDAVSGIFESMDSFLARELVLDLSELSFMDSSGIALVVRAFRRLAASGGRMAIECPQPQPYKVLTAAGMDRLVPIFVKGEVTT